MIATAATGDSVTHVTAVPELLETLDPSGNTQITLWQDISYNIPLRLPYSCTIDFNGFTIATSPDDGSDMEIAQAAGIDVTVTNLYEAGCNVNEHYTWLTDEHAGKDKYQYWITNSMGRWKHGDIRTSYEALDHLSWDVITLQQHFSPERTETYEMAMGSCTPYVRDLFDLLKADHPDAKLYWHETWAYQVGHESIADAAIQANQQENIILVSQKICEENGVDIVPSGDAWVIARADALVGDKLCKSDLYHDGDTGGGQYLNACVWFEVLTGKSCIGNTWRPDYSLSEETIAQLQLAAHEAVAARYGEDYAK